MVKYNLVTFAQAVTQIENKNMQISTKMLFLKKIN